MQPNVGNICLRKQGPLWLRAELLLRREWPRLAFLSEPVALPADVQHVAVVLQPVQHCRGDHAIASRSPHSPKPLLELRMMMPRS